MYNKNVGMIIQELKIEIPTLIQKRGARKKLAEKFGFKPLAPWFSGLSRWEIVILATPKWADNERIKEIYSKARELSESTGIKHEVDHIYPLKSKILCGLHVPDNLRVVPITENRGLKPCQLGDAPND